MGHGCDLANAGVQSQWCFRLRDLTNASGGAIWQVDGCDLAHAGVRRDRCDLGLGVIWGCVRDLTDSALSSQFGVWFFFFFFFFGNGLKVSLERGFGPWGGTIWAGRSLDMGFEPCEECA